MSAMHLRSLCMLAQRVYSGGSSSCPPWLTYSLIIVCQAQVQNMHRDAGRHTIAGAHALPGVMRGDVTGSGGGEMAQTLSFQLNGVPAAPRWTAAAQTPVVAHPEDAEAQRVLDV